MIFKRIFNDFIYNGHLIAIGAVGIVLSSAVLLNIKITLGCLLIVYLLTYSSILYNRYKEQKNDYLTNPERTKNLEIYFRWIRLIILLSIVISIGIMFYSKKNKALIFIILLALSTFLYTRYFKKTTRNIIAFKNIYFSLVTSFLLLFLTLYYSYSFFDISFFLVFTFIFLRMFVNTIFLDIKDVKSDREEHLLTLPIVLGEEKTKVVLKIITFFSILPIIFGVYLCSLPLFSLVLIFIIPYTFYYLKKSSKKENFYLVNYILADLEFSLWPIFILVTKIMI